MQYNREETWVKHEICDVVVTRHGRAVLTRVMNMLNSGLWNGGDFSEPHRRARSL